MTPTLRSAGEAAPAFRLPNQDGVPCDLADFRGRYLLLWWYLKAGTFGWAREGKGFRDRIQDFSSRNAAIAGVSFDSQAKNRAFREKFAFPFDLLSDEDRSVSMSYGAAKRPRQMFARRISYLIDPEGRIARVYEKVRPGKHPDEVLATLDELAWTGEMAEGGRERGADGRRSRERERERGRAADRAAGRRPAVRQRVTGGKGGTRGRWAQG